MRDLCRVWRSEGFSLVVFRCPAVDDPGLRSIADFGSNRFWNSRSESRQSWARNEVMSLMATRPS